MASEGQEASESQSSEQQDSERVEPSLRSSLGKRHHGDFVSDGAASSAEEGEAGEDSPPSGLKRAKIEPADVVRSEAADGDSEMESSEAESDAGDGDRDSDEASDPGEEGGEQRPPSASSLKTKRKTVRRAKRPPEELLQKSSSGSEGQELGGAPPKKDSSSDQHLIPVKSTPKKSEDAVYKLPVWGNMELRIPLTYKDLLPVEDSTVQVERFKLWLVQLLQDNMQHVSTLTDDVVYQAFDLCLRYHCPWSRKAKAANKARRAARVAAKEVLKSSGLAEARSKMAQRPADASQNEIAGMSTTSESNGAAKRSDAELPTASEWADLLGSDNEAPMPQQPAKANVRAPKKEITLNKTESEAAQQSNILLTSDVQDSRLPTGRVELAQQRIYFPSAADPSQMCLLCARLGHLAFDCPTRVCGFCQGREHGTFSCPRRVRCGKCRQLGHGKESCTSKLALAQGESTECAFCGSASHEEGRCDLLWRSFDPYLPRGSPKDTRLHRAPECKKVNALPTFCCVCGAASHFCFDCGLRRAKPMPSMPTWSLRNMSVYLDEKCPDKPIIASEIAYASQDDGPRRPEGKIKGKGPNVHVIYEGSDSEVEFIGSRVEQPKQAGQIRVSSNLQIASQPRQVPSTLPRQVPSTLPRRPQGPLPPANGFTGADTGKPDGLMQNGTAPSQGMPVRLPPHPRGQPALPQPPLPPGPPPGWEQPPFPPPPRGYSILGRGNYTVGAPPEALGQLAEPPGPIFSGYMDMPTPPGFKDSPTDITDMFPEMREAPRQPKGGAQNQRGRSQGGGPGHNDQGNQRGGGRGRRGGRRSNRGGRRGGNFGRN